MCVRESVGVCQCTHMIKGNAAQGRVLRFRKTQALTLTLPLPSVWPTVSYSGKQTGYKIGVSIVPISQCCEEQKK